MGPAVGFLSWTFPTQISRRRGSTRGPGRPTRRERVTPIVRVRRAPIAIPEPAGGRRTRPA
eukprot:13116190-Heterocapsa_arctica.AAC.1